MKNDNAIYKKLIDWCQNNSNIFAVILTSSRSHSNNHTDILSDYDIELHVKDLSFCLNNDNWIEQFGDIMVKWPLIPKTTFSKSWITRLIQFNDGTRIDFQITSKNPVYHSNYDVGYKVIIDKENLTQNIPEPNFANLNIKKPIEEYFQDRINSFFWNSTYVAKNLWRDELYYAKFMLDNILRFDNLQIIIEWYIGLNNNWNVQTNKYGRWFKKYLSTDIWIKLESTYASASIDDNWKALYNIINLFSFLAKEVAVGLKFEYPIELEKNIILYINKIQKTI